jgi:ABC-type multidrug transport system fused ATPase/permease subunit
MIDADSEAKIAEALSEFCRNRTALVIAHRLSTVVDADSIVVMDHGEVVDQGTHSALLGRCALYQQLCRTQLVDNDGATGEASSAPAPAAAR